MNAFAWLMICAGAGGGVPLGYLIGRLWTRREVSHGIAQGIEEQRQQEQFERQQSMLRNGRETYRHPDHEGETATRIGRMDLDPR